ncbi:hypothetical protein [Paraburkholderia caballeronis]|uniref:hypothetical protein n=1 Tax=Paraburkholderia caballeronis TaxID=416943 RepID=UPI0010652127|nr:hypothetical protein [Paraburkholderia caballeronis]
MTWWHEPVLLGRVDARSGISVLGVETQRPLARNARRTGNGFTTNGMHSISAAANFVSVRLFRSVR